MSDEQTIEQLKARIAELEQECKVLGAHLQSREHQVMSICSLLCCDAEEHIESTIHEWRGCNDNLAYENKKLRQQNAALREALRPLSGIADRYDANGLDDEARKFWGRNNEHENTRDPSTIELVQGRGGATLLTLGDCLNARTALTQHDTPQPNQER